MAAQPTQDAIDMMCSLTHIGRPEAISRLKDNNNDVTQAMNEFFDNPSANSYTWDESHFNSDRDGSINKSEISFQVHGPDEHGAGGSLSIAPSRPPSRTSNKSPLPRGISLVGRRQDVLSDDRMMPNEFQDADADLRKALEESAQEAGLSPQEYGVTVPNGVHFGPATRETYEQEKWQMVHLPNASSQDTPRYPDAQYRKREDGVPAFLKPDDDGTNLASILTIYHEIPLGREVFLRREQLQSDFGHNPEWWTGKPIAAGHGGRISSEADLDNGIEVYHELQRLMAFLDKTERSYGSVRALTNLKYIRESQPDDAEGKFFEAWKAADPENSALGSIFSEAIQPNVGGSLEGIETGTRDFAILDLFLPNVEASESLETIYDLTDNALWMYSGLEIGNSAYLTHVADIIGFRLVASESSRSIDIPDVWFPDRYLETGREAALEMRKRQQEVRESMENNAKLENLLRYFTLPDGKLFKVGDIFNTSLMHDAEPALEEVVYGGDPRSIDAEADSESRVSDVIDVSLELKKVMTSIDMKLKALDEEKQKALAILRDLSKLYTQPSRSPFEPPLHIYRLCGVSNKEATYVRRQGEPDLIDMDLNANELSSSTDQWWKINHTMSDARPTIVKKVRLQEVLVAVMTQGQTCVVVYASEKALTEPVKPLPSSLEAFVSVDNLAFSAEFPHIPDLQDSQTSIASPVSPGKRKYDESSDGSEEAPPRYAEQPRWGGASPQHDNGVIVSHRELDGSDDGGSNGYNWPPGADESGGDSATPRGNETPDVIMGQDPNELAGLNFPSLVDDDTHLASQEMQEKRGTSGLLSSVMRDPVKKTDGMDSMDVDDMAIDEAHASPRPGAFATTGIESKQ